MTQYWKEHYDQNTEAFQTSLYKQVGKTLNGIDVDERQLDCIVASIVNALDIEHKDEIIDLCCGNGLITKKIAVEVNKINAVDFSDGLIDTAKRESYLENITYIASDVMLLSNTFFNEISKIYMYEALQHFSIAMLADLLSILSSTGNNIKFFIGSVPDKEKIWTYYDTEEKREFFLQRENENKPHMGKWWDKNEIQNIALAHDFKASFYNQNEFLYTSNYRFNCLLEKF